MTEFLIREILRHAGMAAPDIADAAWGFIRRAVRAGFSDASLRPDSLGHISGISGSGIQTPDQ
jgi:hypothetical protein